MPTKKKIATSVAMVAAVLVVASVGSGPAWVQMIWE